MLALLDVKNEVKNLSKTLHNLIIENTIDWKLWPVKSWKHTPYF